jgi:hypothetical protein
MNKANNVLALKPEVEQKTTKKWSLKEHLTELNK